MNKIMAIDANPFAVRAVLVQDGLTLLDSLEAKPHRLGSVIRFVDKHARSNPGLRVVGSPLDSWPDGLQWQLEDAGHLTRWLPPHIARGVQHDWAPWQLRRRLLRARLLAYLDHQATLEPCSHYLPYHALRWERLMALESLQEIDDAAQHAGLYIADLNPDF